MNDEKEKTEQNNNNIIEEDIIKASIPFQVYIKNIKSICRIGIKDRNLGTGFFIKINLGKDYYFMITNEHVIPLGFVEAKKIIIITLNKEKNEKEEEEEKYEIKLDKTQRRIICLNANDQDITAVEILEKDELKNKVKFLTCDLNYIDGYEQYLKQEVFILEHPHGETLHGDVGLIVNFSKMNQNYKFNHTLSTSSGSSGSPIILVYNERVVGVHFGCYGGEKYNSGTFIGEIIDVIKKEIIADEKKTKIPKKGKKGKKVKKSKKESLNDDESKEKLFKYKLNGEEKVSKITDSIIIMPNDEIIFNINDNI